MRVIIQVVNFFEGGEIRPRIEFDLPYDIELPEELTKKIGKREVSSMVAILTPQGGDDE